MRKYHAHNPVLWTPAYGVRGRKMPGELETWPLCIKCDRPVEAYGVAEEGSKRIDVWARCHGSHEALRITWDHLFGHVPSWEELQREISNLPFFKKEVSET